MLLNAFVSRLPCFLLEHIQTAESRFFIFFIFLGGWRLESSPAGGQLGQDLICVKSQVMGMKCQKISNQDVFLRTFMCTCSIVWFVLHGRQAMAKVNPKFFLGPFKIYISKTGWDFNAGVREYRKDILLWYIKRFIFSLTTSHKISRTLTLLDITVTAYQEAKFPGKNSDENFLWIIK